jgi:endonuclease III
MISREFGMGGDWFRSVRARLQKRGINLTIINTYFTEMPIDIHVRRVFKRLFPRYGEPQDLQNLARIIYPENPGCVDIPIWKLGREICSGSKPKCRERSLTTICEWRQIRLANTN